MRKMFTPFVASVLVSLGLHALGGCTPPSGSQQPSAAPTTPPPPAASSQPTPAASVEKPPVQPATTKPAATEGPKASDADVQAVATGNNAFGFDLYHQLAAGNASNMIFSPISISAALAMAYAGAGSSTASEMARTLHFTLPADKLHPAIGSMLWRLQPQDEKKANGFTLRIANSMWVDKKFKMLDSFSKTVTTNYHAPTELVNFAEQPEPSRSKINQWVEQQTEKKIQDLLPKGSIEPVTKVVLANAIYFHGQWLTKFIEDATKDRPFRTASGKSVKVPTMAVESHFGYAKGKGYQALAMSYRGPASMIIVLPDSGKLGAIERQLSTKWFADLDSQMHRATVNVELPKFKVSPESINLKKVLSRMGMPQAFSMSADFSGIDGAKDLLISGVFHKAFIDVDEKGTEAAAATAVVIGLKSAVMPSKPIDFHADRPFLFFIRDNATRTILFAGRVMDPSK